MNALWHAIINPWTWWRASPPPGWTYGLETYWPIVVQGILVSVALGLIGCFLVVRGTSLLGDALSHSVLPGIVIGFLISVRLGGGSLHSPWILVGATAVGILAAVLVETVHSNSRVKEDASLGIIFTTLFAIGVVMINLFAGQADLDPGCVLYGNIENFVIHKWEGIRPMLVIVAAIVVALLLFYRQLLVSTFDPALAVSLGIPATLVHYALTATLSLTVVASFESVGAILAVALLIMPGATARLWVDRMPAMLLFAAAHGVLSTLIGYWLSHESVLNTSASGSICVAGFALFVVSWMLAPRQGIIVQVLVRRRLSNTIVSENLIKAIAELDEARKVVTVGALRAELRMEAKAFDRALRRAIDAGWVRRASHQADATLELTPTGQAQGHRLARAHVLWEQFLTRQVGIAPDHVHDAAEWIEHHLNEEKVKRLDEELAGGA
jgi:manganese/zinc/iron transport system permease protein